ncbi:MAG TPA: phosphoglucosamine mutase [Acidimicrobiia bacterium]|nr:phosphoglucosamine mutase [Acidimicrobiia bacterium]
MTLRFGTDGVRGVANSELTVELVTALGRAVVRVLGADQTFVVGRDTRRSGPMLEAALVAGICGEGGDVVLAGVLPTPGIAQIARDRAAAAAVISASHNPYEDNGVKLFAPGGRKIPEPLEGQIEHELATLAETMPAPGPSGVGVGVASEHRGGFDDYVAHLVDSLDGRLLQGARVVLDCGNGAAFRSAPAALRGLMADVHVLHAAPDGTNINEKCGSTHPEQLAEVVVATNAQIGLAFDGDADRVIAVDERGQVVDGDQMLAIGAIDLHDRGMLRGNAVVATVMSNVGLDVALHPYGIELLRTPVGDRNVLDELERRDLVLGGEQSGHLINMLHATTGDGTLTGILLLDVMVRRHRTLSELAAVMSRVPQVLRNVPMYEPEALNGDGAFWGRVAEIDADLGDTGRVLVRLSGTEPLVRVMVESPDPAAASAAADRLVALIEHVARRAGD